MTTDTRSKLPVRALISFGVISLLYAFFPPNLQQQQVHQTNRADCIQPV